MAVSNAKPRHIEGADMFAHMCIVNAQVNQTKPNWAYKPRPILTIALEEAKNMAAEYNLTDSEIRAVVHEIKQALT